MADKQPLALYLADDIEANYDANINGAAAELRRQHALIAELMGALEKLNKAINYRSAALVSGTDEQVEFAAERLWDAQDTATSALAKAKEAQQ